jgi:hypothetical protein
MSDFQGGAIEYSHEHSTEAAPAPRDVPQDARAEERILGAMLCDALPDVFVVQSDDFNQQRHQHICEVVHELRRNGQTVDSVTIGEALRSHGHLEICGGSRYLEKLASIYRSERPNAKALIEYSNLLREKANARLGLQALEVARAKFLNGVGVDGGTSFLRETISTLEMRQSTKKRNYCTMADLDGILSDVSWLWPNWIPNGFPTVVCGGWSAGKSNVALDWCQRILTGENWPDGAQNPRIGRDDHILWIDTEASQALLRQRVVERGMDDSRFILPPNPLREIQLDNENDWRFIDGALEDFKPPLVVVDSLSGGHGGDSNSNDFMKNIMKRIASTAQRHNCAFVVMAGLKKSIEGLNRWPVTMDMIMGASAVAQYARSVIGVGAPDPRQPNERAMMSVKNNLAPAPPMLGYSIHDFGPAWGDAPAPVSHKSAHAEARAFLLDNLGDGQMRPSQELIEACVMSGVCSERTLKDVFKALGGKAKREGGRDGRWFWSLPESREYSPGEGGDAE